jgi:hypothetical protein
MNKVHAVKMTLLAPLLLATVLALTSPATADPKQTADTAVQFAKDYLERLKRGDVAAATTDMWNVDALLSSTFGLVYLQLPDAEKTAARHAFVGTVTAPFANPRVAQFFSTVTIQDAHATLLSDTQVAVTLTFANPGKPSLSNTLLLSKTGDSWKIVDQRQGAGPSLRCALGMMWSEGLRNHDTSLSSIFEKAAAKVRQQVGTN